MSAFIVSPQHINALVTFALSRPLRHQRPSYYIPGKGRTDVSEATADLLWKENIRSVQGRYPTDAWHDLPGPIKKPVDLDYQRVTTVNLPRYPKEGEEQKEVPIDAADIIGMCDCLSYQSCESEDWEQTEAYAALRAIRNAAVDVLVERANPNVTWEI